MFDCFFISTFNMCACMRACVHACVGGCASMRVSVDC